MHKYELLRLRAEEFRRVLEEYAKKDPDVADFLERWMPWYERVQKREIRLPCYSYNLGVFFTNPDLSPLADRYMYNNHQIPLGDAMANFDIAMLDWLSDPKYVARRVAAGTPLDLIPDEPPPPEEEAPLPPRVTEPQPKQARTGWLHRWIFGEKKNPKGS